MGTGGKARPGRDADHSPSSSAEVVNEWELYLLSPHAPPWRVEGLLYFLLELLKITCTMTLATGNFQNWPLSPLA
jgi:hypothetical protein